MIEKLKELIGQVTEEAHGSIDLTLDANLISDVGLDSLQFINLILALEEEFNLGFDFDDLDFDEISVVGKLIAYIEENRNDK